MNIDISTNGYRVLSSGMVILNSSDNELNFKIEASNTFSFGVKLIFIDTKDEGSPVEKMVENNTIIFKCSNFNNVLGTGTVRPLPIATVSGKNILLHFWSYLLGDKESARKIEYTFLEEE